MAEKRAVNFLFIVAGPGRVHYSRILGNAEIEQSGESTMRTKCVMNDRTFFPLFSQFEEPRDRRDFPPVRQKTITSFERVDSNVLSVTVKKGSCASTK